MGRRPLDPWRERDACGVGFIARSSGETSHDILRLGLTALARLQHRGAQATDKSGDGAGILTQIPRRFFARTASELGVPLGPRKPFAVGAFFLPREAGPRAQAVQIIEEVLSTMGSPVLAWRDVPVAADTLGTRARTTQPAIRQAILGPPSDQPGEEKWERRLYLARRTIEQRASEEEVASLYVCSLSCRSVVYKALLNGGELPVFYPDLQAPDYETAIVVFHQRYSTNTLPSWPLVQPFRLLAHNGEINTLWGNRNAMRAREGVLQSRVWGRDVERLKPVIWPDGSDSASLDDVMEFLVRSGRDPVHALMMMVPEAWERVPDMDPALRSFYEFHAGLMEPWDGPAALAFSDGRLAGSALDRNGLRPCRYKVSRDGLVVACSEVGVVDFDPADVIESGRLGPGELLVVDTVRGIVVHSAEAKREVAERKPYARWVARTMRELGAPEGDPPPAPPADELLPRQRAFGYCFEDLRYVLEPMGDTGQEPLWSMGDDTPIAPLSRLGRSLYDYFRQRFAQVTNPAIDPLREQIVMSLVMRLGRRGSILAEHASGRPLLRIEQPVLLEEEMAALRRAKDFNVTTLDATFDAAGGSDALDTSLDALCTEATRAVRRGTTLLILSDRGTSRERAPIPMLLAIGAVHQHLLRTRLRMRTGIVAEVGDAWATHHIAALFGYGAEAVHPWLALEAVRTLGTEEGDAGAVRHKYRSAIEKGLLKILSKMGIATLPSYAGAQIFEALGLGTEVVERCFTGTVSAVGGIGMRQIAEDVLARHIAAYPAEGAVTGLPDVGRIRYRRDGEDHGWSPPLVRALQQAVNAASTDRYHGFAAGVHGRDPAGPRDLLGFRPRAPIPLEEVEPVEAIRRRFISSAMSLGALSPETHATLALGMNRMGARSNSGEGGEDPQLYTTLPNGDRSDNRIKQVASGRFGVTTEYLVRADELEIKISQGSKPGEGGQLPGHKVTEIIARLRHAVPGIPLISPPPHHDIYSIEDLAQLIHDLKQVNPSARVGVKLVAEAGVGTVAAGVAKAFADYVLIAGNNGGTGASPLSSIHHAGSPWELGLAETQAVLLQNGLRERVEVRVDGGLRTGRDVVIGALLGAESFGFGTAALVAVGCAMARQCHLNTCPTGIATQRPELRKKFKGTPEQVVAYFTLLAQDVRRILAELGFGSMDEIIGRVELLEQVDRPDAPRGKLLDFSPLLAAPAEPERPRRRTVERNVRGGLVSLDAEILKDLDGALELGRPFTGEYAIGNHHLTVGARIAGHIARRLGPGGLEAPVRLQFRGSAGQSFGAWAVPRMRLDLEGEANDHVGKGLSGGEITIRPFGTAAYTDGHRDHVLIGNTALYGATAGRLFVAGAAGDRFAVRNSGAVAVVEGTGDHCCEYMTGGVVVVLGHVGWNLGAGMSNGVAYVLDQDNILASRCNFDMVDLIALDAEDEQRLHSLLREHWENTESVRAERILDSWARFRSLFRKVQPRAPTAPAVVPPRAKRAERLVGAASQTVEVKS